MIAKSFFSLTLAMVLGLFLMSAPAEAETGHITLVTVPTLNNTLEVPGTDIYYVTTNGVARFVFIADKGQAALKEPVALYLNNSPVLKSYRNGH